MGPPALIGLCLLAGASRHHAQRFRLHGVSAALTLVLLAVYIFTTIAP